MGEYFKMGEYFNGWSMESLFRNLHHPLHRWRYYNRIIKQLTTAHSEPWFFCFAIKRRALVLRLCVFYYSNNISGNPQIFWKDRNNVWSEKSKDLQDILILFKMYNEKYQNRKWDLCLNGIIQANLILFLREETAQPSLPDNKLQILRLQNWSKAGFFRKNPTNFLMGCAYFPLKV